MANIASSELFKMRIPSPDPGLTGEALTKAVPDDLSRKGTVYADQYLADKCPPEFDELQRRQFFCILDLRRLKHAANAIFAKKEWKLNIMNFAKEYEKSRGLIMLRYGLYEFKNVKPSAELLKRWRAAHGLPEPDPEPQTTTPKPDGVGSATAGTGSTKRKADDDLQPKDNTLMASTANQNKKRNVEQSSAFDMPRFAPTPMKSKRKADEAEKPDENQRSKLQKPTSSAAKSKLESIIDNVQSGSSASSGSPLKRTLFGANSAASISTQTPLFGFGSTPATGSANIFSYLSESSANNSGNENGDADAETDDESGHASEPEIGSQDVAPSYEPSAAASTGTSTPPTQGAPGLFAPGKTNNTDSISSAASKPPESATKGGLFDRVSMGSDGQPLRATPPAEEPRDPAPAEQNKSVFGGQPNGSFTTPGFSFTSATPPQNTPNTFVSKPAGVFGNLLQAGTSTGASSPFPAPSSMNTTPVNGTPEPQTQQGYDDEAPQEQISLINGGPGEEDETILHEVRAKAIVYKAVKPDEDDADKKSPWRTQGIGPLRVLKNKTTGTVRILLRAEPRGHIALNKTILSDYTYKADAKTLKITAASDDGNSLETWLLQVKRPEMAAELAGVLEANKAANKK
ncbi:uncharacterized protein BCR38DRAFT_334897 [Pseudomassariella vexata]|uniref:RanBD1 domain-containing protein n=1 Tax=Pseudomassariella vexata TaxID=1141098 RepID=A0A1Y2EB76_9PEZI|nr:uncharacterized protein BCR38DRAFT_334897 [Pseudomassariella vexata]ORY68812.1 hypothetical protein BCR38DRAFT_334897 [Pseudomassariella vexata]